MKQTIARPISYDTTTLLTLNPSDFTRYPGIIVVRPQEIASAP
jgi:hypothetical protein